MQRVAAVLKLSLDQVFILARELAEKEPDRPKPKKARSGKTGH
jgi:hypothetical protein